MVPMPLPLPAYGERWRVTARLIAVPPARIIIFDRAQGTGAWG